MYNKPKHGNSEDGVIRVRTPKHGEMLAFAIEMLGGGRFRLDCLDGKERMGRIPGKFKRRMWVRANDLILIEPWSIEPDKADIIWRYTPAQCDWLKKKGFLDRK